MSEDKDALATRGRGRLNFWLPTRRRGLAPGLKVKLPPWPARGGDARVPYGAIVRGRRSGEKKVRAPGGSVKTVLKLRGMRHIPSPHRDPRLFRAGAFPAH
ncbi:hypothetical protein AAFF_G00028510 [Aldrovandia affinis]|uniref:Uncharacterized protein n=1 Tax=Aldrovandia affinis TaxID=143900 RepID=A0AAD7WH45_9TELE|nr:hypothetical protein AAFF_G00028510 [Aldrovandia affinis]